METLAAGHRSNLWANVKRNVMGLFLIFSIIAFLVIVGNALLLLRTARKPKLPETVRPRSCWDDED
jgi:hypothetical protein